MTPPSAAVPTATLLAAVALLLGACGSAPLPPGSTSAVVTPSTAAPQPTFRVLPLMDSVPPPREPVTGQGTVLQTPDGPPELCLGPVAESWPPQCQGIPLTGWDWDSAGPYEKADLEGKVTRWSTFAVTGRLTRTGMTVTEVVPLPLYDPPAQPSPRPSAPPPLGPQQWEAVRERLMGAPGLLTVDRPDDAGPMQLLVVHDDGSIQAWADASFGAGVVVVSSALR